MLDVLFVRVQGNAFFISIKGYPIQGKSEQIRIMITPLAGKFLIGSFQNRYNLTPKRCYFEWDWIPGS